MPVGRTERFPIIRQVCNISTFTHFNLGGGADHRHKRNDYIMKKLVRCDICIFKGHLLGFTFSGTL